MRECNNTFDLIRTQDADKRLAKSASTRRRDVAARLQPAPFPIGKRQTGYLRYEIDALIAARAASVTDVQIRELVVHLLAEREALLAPFGSWPKSKDTLVEHAGATTPESAC